MDQLSACLECDTDRNSDAADSFPIDSAWASFQVFLLVSDTSRACGEYITHVSCPLLSADLHSQDAYAVLEEEVVTQLTYSNTLCL